MLNPDKSDAAYAKQFRDGNALTRGIIKFCPCCMDGECFHPRAKNYSTTKRINNHSCQCWVMADEGCSLNKVESVLESMRNSGRFYQNPLFEENPKPREFPIELNKAAEIWERINPDIRRCECGEPLRKGHKFCSDCAKKRRRNTDRIRKASGNVTENLQG